MSPECLCPPPAAPGKSASSAPCPPQLRLFDQPLILMGQQMTMDLSHRVHGRRHHDQQRGAAEQDDRNLGIGDHELRDQADDSQIGGAEHGDAGQHPVDMLGGALARADAGHEAAMLLEIVRRLDRIEHDRGVEEAEEDNQRRIEEHEQRPTMREVGRHRRQDAGAARSLREASDRGRQQQQRRGEDRRDHAGGVELQRQERGLALIHAVADLALGVVDQQAALGALDEDHEGDDADRHHHDEQQQAGRDRALAAELERLRQLGREFGDDAGEDDHRRAVADAAAGDLLAEPEQEHGAADQRDRGRDQEERPRLQHEIARALQTDADAPGLEQRQHQRQIARVLVEDLAARLAFLLQRLEGRDDAGEQLDDDRGRDVRHDRQREDREPADRTAGEHVEQAEHTRLGLLEQVRDCIRIHAGQRDIGAEPVDDQRPQREPDPLLQFVGLGQRAEVQVCRKLFSRRCHASGPWVFLWSRQSNGGQGFGPGRRSR
ncbi:conserved hypothetical protein [Bosea sp. EC-HK365B]|nr:conserved hypothetical protein [Bosea sp. 21B]CAD5271931.1 conserved hypothetical protein [Bosea sp. 7B]VVT55944.1 conserved hypothetical protein [Bosea sp. EC-HK365B]VXC69299.1 conserved hypothetical protein [Bosea sp. 127]